MGACCSGNESKFEKSYKIDEAPKKDDGSGVND